MHFRRRLFPAISVAGLVATLALTAILSIHLISPNIKPDDMAHDIIYLDYNHKREPSTNFTVSPQKNEGNFGIILISGTDEGTTDSRISRPDQPAYQSCLATRTEPAL